MWAASPPAKCSVRKIGWFEPTLIGSIELKRVDKAAAIWDKGKKILKCKLAFAQRTNNKAFAKNNLF